MRRLTPVTKLDKLFIKILQARRELRFEELQKALIHLGYERCQGKGSHVVFRHNQHPVIVVPARSPVKRVYVEQVLEVLKHHFSDKNGA